MKRLHITAEGQTEEAFVNKTLKSHLARFQVYADVRCVLTSRHGYKSFRGGMTTYQKAKGDIVKWLKEEEHNNDVVFTTMFDFYALPPDFPGYEQASHLQDPYKKIELIESEFAKDISDYRFVPYIQLHEFEALLFTDPQALEIVFFDADKAIKRLIAIKEQYVNPELINSSPENAPSKRIIKEFPDYENNKAAIGSMVTDMIGIDALKASCSHFRNWIMKMENL